MNTKFLKAGVVAAMVVMVTGCASVGSVGNKMVDNQVGGVIYGAAGVVTESTVKSWCDAIASRDSRCSHPEDFVLVSIYSKFGFADGAVGINALAPKNFPGIEKLRHNYATGDKMLPYVKAKVTPGQLGTLLEIVSTDGDGKCTWSGMPRAGGTVCPAFNYDYRKDYTGVVFR